VATLVVTRASGGFRDPIHRYWVLLDGRTVGTLGRGESMQMPLQSGPHRLQVKIGTEKSQAFVIDGDGDRTLAFRCGSTGSAWDTMEDVFRGDGGYIFLRPDPDAPEVPARRVQTGPWPEP
jgi:hypothetical protein